jgi:hypothetical protein
MNLGWTDNETAQTAVDRSQWFFSWKSGSGVTDDAILYGQPIAIAWGPGTRITALFPLLTICNGM